MTGYTGNIEELAIQNKNFRQVVHTTLYTQLVVMSLNPEEEIGEETHDKVDQFFRIELGTLKVVMNGEEHILSEGMVAIVPAGVKHNLINIGPNIAKLYTLYSPPNHPANTVHITKAEAQADEHDH